jgi:hypothetical protein
MQIWMNFMLISERLKKFKKNAHYVFLDFFKNNFCGVVIST